MAFKEDFPSLVKYMCSHCGKIHDSTFQRVNVERMIQDNCKDNQRVKEAIDKILFEKHHYYDIKPMLKELNKTLKKELGLI